MERGVDFAALLAGMQDNPVDQRTDGPRSVEPGFRVFKRLAEPIYLPLIDFSNAGMHVRDCMRAVISAFCRSSSSMRAFIAG